MTGAETIDALVAEFAAAWKRHDMTAWGNLYTEDADFVNIFGDLWEGRERIASEHAARHALQFRTSDLVILSKSVRMLRPDIGILRLRWRLDGLRNLDGERVPSISGLIIHVLEQRDGRWHIAATQNTEPVTPH